MIASGCHLILFSTGRGSFVGSAISPVIKVCGNPKIFQNLEGDMDINAGKMISEGAESLFTPSGFIPLQWRKWFIV